MRIPFSIACPKCGGDLTGWADLSDSQVVVSGKCGHEISGSLGPNVTLGYMVLARARHEFVVEKDYSLSIVFSAMAFECELSRLHHKWESIAALDASSYLDDEQLDDLLRRYPNIKDKTNKVCSLMHHAGLEGFVASNLELAQGIDSNFPSLKVGRLAEGLQEVLFWPRNRILHLGYSQYGESDANRSLNVADWGVGILEVMDREKRLSLAP